MYINFINVRLYTKQFDLIRIKRFLFRIPRYLQNFFFSRMLLRSLELYNYIQFLPLSEIRVIFPDYHDPVIVGNLNSQSFTY